MRCPSSLARCESRRAFLLANALLLMAAGAVPAAEATTRRILVCGQQTALLEISAEHPAGKKLWSHPASTREGWVLPSGNILLALSRGAETPGGAAVEIEPGREGAADRVVWRYDGRQEEVNSIQKTAEGTYVLTEAGQPQNCSRSRQTET